MKFDNLSFNIDLVLTSKCNNRCVMCFDGKYLNRKQSELSYNQWISFINKVKHKKPIFFVTGGEPFLNKDCIRILSFIKRQNLGCGVCTNGSLFSDNLIKKLAALDLDNVVFSLHGSKKVHDKITRVKNSYDKAISNIKKFCKLKKNTFVLVNYVFFDQSIDEVENMIKECEQAGVDAVRLTHLGFITTKEMHRNQMIMKKHFRQSGQLPVEVHHYVKNSVDKSFVNKIKKLRRKKFNIPVLIKPDMNDKEINDWYSSNVKCNRKCLFLWKGAVIDTNGDVFPCQTIKLKLGNILENDLQEIYNSKNAMKLRKLIKKKLLPACLRCCMR